MKTISLRASCLGCLLLLFALGVAAAADKDQFTRAFDVPPDFLTSRQTPAKPNITAQEILTAEGIDFPRGASAVFNAATSMLIVRNTQASLAAVEAWLEKTWPGRAAAKSAAAGAPGATGALNVIVVALTYEVPKKDALVAQALDPKRDAPTLLAKASAMAARGQSKVLVLPALTGRSGQRSTVTSGDLVLEMEPVLNAKLKLLNLTGTFNDGKHSVAFKTATHLDGTISLGVLDSVGGRDTVQLLFMKVSAQPAGPAL